MTDRSVTCASRANNVRLNALFMTAHVRTRTGSNTARVSRHNFKHVTSHLLRFFLNRGVSLGKFLKNVRKIYNYRLVARSVKSQKKRITVNKLFLLF